MEAKRNGKEYANRDELEADATRLLKEEQQRWAADIQKPRRYPQPAPVDPNMRRKAEVGRYVREWKAGVNFIAKKPLIGSID